MDSLIIMQLAVSGGVWMSGGTRFGVQACWDFLGPTTAGAVAHGFLAMGEFIIGTGGGSFAPLPMTYSCGFVGAPDEGNASRHHSHRGISCSRM